MKKQLLAAVLIVLPTFVAANDSPQPLSIRPKVDENSVMLSVEYSAELAQDVRVQAECRLLTATGDLGKLVDDAPERAGKTLVFSFADIAVSVETLRCVVLSGAGSVVSTPLFDVDVVAARQCKMLQRQRELRDKLEGENYRPPSRIIFDRFEREGKDLTLYLKTLSPGQVKARIIGKEGEIGPTSLQFEHPLRFASLEPGKTYQFEVWVVDAGGKKVEASVASSLDGKPLEYPMPVDPGKPGITIGKSGQVGIIDRRTAKDVTFTAHVDRDAHVEFNFTKVLDRARGEFQPGPSKTADLKGGEATAITVELSPGSEYDFDVTARNLYGETARRGPFTVSTLKEFGFEKPVEISLTPIGFLVTVTATEKPDRAGIRLAGKGYQLATPAEKIESETVTLALSAKDLKAFAGAFANLTPGEKRPGGSRRRREKAEAVTPSIEWPTVEVYLGRDNAPDVTQKFRVALDSVETTKEKIVHLNVADEDKAKLTNAATEAAKQQWGGTWGEIISIIVRVALSAL